MRAGWAMVLWVSMASAGLASCARPVVRIRHDLPRAVPLPPDTSALRAGAFVIRGLPDGALDAYMRQALGERLAAAGAGEAGATTSPAGRVVIEVGGVIDVKVDDQRGRRKVLRRGGRDGGLVGVELAWLVRTVRVDVRFQMARPGGGELGFVESRRSYVSTADPNVRGELGLNRLDDPNRVPPAEQIIRPLLAECAREFAAMVAPVVVQANVPLRPVLSREGAEGIAAAGAGDLQAAKAHFQAAHARAPADRDVLFNLAVVREALGELPAAAMNYEQLVRLGELAAAEGARRVGRLMDHRPGAPIRPQ